MPEKARERSAEREEDARDEDVAPRAFWSGTITFGLVSIPVDLMPAKRGSARPSLRMLTGDGTPLHREYVCPRDGVPVAWDDIVRGYELDDGRYVVVTDEELEDLSPEKTRDISLIGFVDCAELPAMLFRRGYFLLPAGRSQKAYHLLADTLGRSRKAGIATFVMRDKEYAVAILADHGILRAETLRFAGELRSATEVGLPEKGAAPDDAQVARFAKIIAARSADTVPLEELEDEYATRLRALAEDKRARGEGVIEVSSEAAEADPSRGSVDLMQVLKQRLSGTEPRAAQRPASAARSAPKKAKKSNEKAPAEPRKGEPSKGQLYARAKKLGIEGRSQMTKEELVTALRRAGS